MPLAETQTIVIAATSGMGRVIARVSAQKRTRVGGRGSLHERVDSTIKGLGPRVADIVAAAVLATANGCLAGAVTNVDGGGFLV